MLPSASCPVAAIGVIDDFYDEDFAWRYTPAPAVGVQLTPWIALIVLKQTEYSDGKDITNVRPNKRGLGVVFQSYALFPHMTVAQNVGFGLEMRGIGKAECAERIRETLALVRLDALAARYPRYGYRMIGAKLRQRHPAQRRGDEG